jgi:hypothetical protein
MNRAKSRAARVFVFVGLAVIPAIAYLDDGVRGVIRDRAQVRAFRQLNPCPATGKTGGPCGGWVVDHVVALCRQGPDASANMAWMQVVDGKLKDKFECTDQANEWLQTHCHRQGAIVMCAE